MACPSSIRVGVRQGSFLAGILSLPFVLALTSSVSPFQKSRGFNNGQILAYFQCLLNVFCRVIFIPGVSTSKVIIDWCNFSQFLPERVLDLPCIWLGHQYIQQCIHNDCHPWSISSMYLGLLLRLEIHLM